MFLRMLVPLDGSRLAEAALPAATRLALLTRCSATLLHVIEKRPPATIHGDTHLRDVDRAEEYLGGVAARLRGAGVSVQTHVHTVPRGDVPRCIAEHAGELEQDLIVLCRHGAGGLRRFVFGSNAEQVLTHGATPVLLIQAGEEGAAKPFGPHRILALVDKTPATRPALAMAAELASLAGCALHLLSVVTTADAMTGEEAMVGRLVPGTTRQLLDLITEEETLFLQEEVNRLGSSGVAVNAAVERGDAGARLVEASRETGADLVVAAARGSAGLSAFWNDALTRKVAEAYDGALLLIPRG
jgi:nucleotide-binding universal stress UspA family protein